MSWLFLTLAFAAGLAVGLVLLVWAISQIEVWH